MSVWPICTKKKLNKFCEDFCSSVGYQMPNFPLSCSTYLLMTLSTHCLCLLAQLSRHNSYPSLTILLPSVCPPFTRHELMYFPRSEFSHPCFCIYLSTFFSVCIVQFYLLNVGKKITIKICDKDEQSIPMSSFQKAPCS